jgi:hypothetical protein
MNRESLSPASRAPGLTPVSAEELTLVSGGGLWSWLKGAVGDAVDWVRDHLFVDYPVFGYKGRF